MMQKQRKRATIEHDLEVATQANQTQSWRRKNED